MLLLVADLQQHGTLDQISISAYGRN